MPYIIKKVKGGYKVQNSETKHVYSNNPLTKLRAEKQMKAILISEHNSHSKLNEMINKHINKLIGGNIITDVVNDGIDIVKNTIHGLLSEPKHLIFNTKSPQTDKVLEKYGDYYISRMKIHRKPIEKMLTEFVNVLSLGDFNDIRE